MRIQTNLRRRRFLASLLLPAVPTLVVPALAVPVPAAAAGPSYHLDEDSGDRLVNEDGAFFVLEEG